MSRPWPPPPDLDSLQELFATADVEGFIAKGAPADEYHGEAEALFQQIGQFPTSDLIAARLTPLLETIWSSSFDLDSEELAQRNPRLLALAQQIERFFGPAASPQVRGASQCPA